jgi:hypothetical protein
MSTNTQPSQATKRYLQLFKIKSLERHIKADIKRLAKMKEIAGVK